MHRAVWLLALVFISIAFCDPAYPEARHEGQVQAIDEAGVQQRVLTNYFGEFALPSGFSLRMGGSLSFLEQWGISLIGLGGTFRLGEIQSLIVAEAQQERWPDWNVTENRAELYWEYAGLPRLRLSLGFAYRSPQFDSGSFLQSLAWPSDVAEISLIYRLSWLFYTSPKINASLKVWDYDRMRLYTPSNIHFSLEPVYEFSENWNFYLSASIGLKGVSGAVISFSQESLSLGFVYAL